MNILVTGSNGQLGSEIKYLGPIYRYLKSGLILNGVFNPFATNYMYKYPKSTLNFFFTDKNSLDITDKEAVERFINEKNIDLIINCAAYTAVDRAEEEREKADLVNNRAVEYLAESARGKDIPLIHISTDYVFDGKNYRPYVEEDSVNPQGVYGLTKLKGEEAFKKSGAKGIIIRTSWVYSSYGDNFLKTMLRLKDRGELNVVFDQVGTPTYAGDLAGAILEIVDKHLEKIKNKKAEIYHYSNEGVISWYDFAKAVFEIENINIKVNPIETKDYPTPAKRPHYSVLNKKKIKKEFNIEIPYWRESLRKCLQRIDNG